MAFQQQHKKDDATKPKLLFCFYIAILVLSAGFAYAHSASDCQWHDVMSTLITIVIVTILGMIVYSYKNPRFATNRYTAIVLLFNGVLLTSMWILAFIYVLN